MEFKEILPIIVIVALVIFLVYSLKGNKGNNNAVSKPVAIDNTDYDGPLSSVQITNCGPNKIEVIKCVREAKNSGLAEAKSIVETHGLIENLPSEKAEQLVEKLNAAGASAEIK